MSSNSDWRRKSSTEPRGAMYRPIADPNCPICHGGKWVYHLTPEGQRKFDAGEKCDMTRRENVDFGHAYLCRCCKPTPRAFEVEE